MADSSYRLLVLLLALCAACAPAAIPAPPSPAAAPTPTSPPASATAQPAPPDYLDEIFMMDGTSGWAWAVRDQQERFPAHTSDGGRTWTPLDLWPYLSPSSPPYLFHPLDARTAWVILGDDLLLRTSDGGQSWDVVNRNLQAAFVVPTHDWYILHFADASHGWLDAGYAAAGAHEFFYETFDGGRSWHPLDFATWPADLNAHHDRPNELAFWTIIDMIYYDAARFIIAPGEQQGTLRMFLSTDWGKSWHTVELPPSDLPGPAFRPSDRRIGTPVFFDPRTGVLIVSNLNRDTGMARISAYATSDGGLTWTLSGGPSSIPDPRSEIRFLSPRDAVVVCGARFCVTHDSGATWLAHDLGVSLPADGADTHYQLDFVDPATGWLLFKKSLAGGSGMTSRLLQTLDGGLTWTELAPRISR